MVLHTSAIERPHPHHHLDVPSSSRGHGCCGCCLGGAQRSGFVAKQRFLRQADRAASSLRCRGGRKGESVASVETRGAKLMFAGLEITATWAFWRLQRMIRACAACMTHQTFIRVWFVVTASKKILPSFLAPCNTKLHFNALCWRIL